MDEGQTKGVDNAELDQMIAAAGGSSVSASDIAAASSSASTPAPSSSDDDGSVVHDGVVTPPGPGVGLPPLPPPPSGLPTLPTLPAEPVEPPKPADPVSAPLPPAPPLAPVPMSTADEPAPLPAGPPASPAGSSLPADLNALKLATLEELRPLVDKLDLPPEDKFDTLLLIIRTTDDASLLDEAHAAAKAIPDETRRAKALLDIIKEIDFFGQQGK